MMVCAIVAQGEFKPRTEQLVYVKNKILGSLVIAALAVWGATPGVASSRTSNEAASAARVANMVDQARERLAHRSGDLKIADRLRDTAGSATVFVEVNAESGLAARGKTLRAGRGLAQATAAGSSIAAKTQRTSRAVQAAATTLDADAQILYEASYSAAGFAAHLDAAAIAALAQRTDVVSIAPVSRYYRPETTSTPAGGHATPNNASSASATRTFGAWNTGATGAGQTIAVIDTGLDYTHATFGGPGSRAAYDLAYAERNSTDPIDPDFVDGAKFAGGVDFAGEAYEATAIEGDESGLTPVPVPDNNPVDSREQGHGTHVSATAAGYGVDGAGNTFAGDYGSLTLSEAHAFKVAPGTAPDAKVVALKVFGDKGGSTDLAGAALEWVAQNVDTIDVVNMSIGSDFAPADDPDNAKIDALTEAGVVVVAAAGNAGNVTAAGGSPGSAKSAVAVAASDSGYVSYDTAVIAALNDLGGNYPGRYDNVYQGPAVTARIVRLPFGNEGQLCAPLTPFQESRVAGMIVWIDQDVPRYLDPATCPYFEVLHDAGVKGIIVAGEDAFYAPTGTEHFPTFALAAVSAQILEDGLGHNMTITLDPSRKFDYTEHNALLDSTLAGFSSRGEFGAYGQTVKPDVAAPGYGIVSAFVGSGTSAESMDGTSMASPQVAGIAALVREANPGYSALDVKKALINNATIDLTVDGGIAGPLRAGTGGIDAAAAVASSIAATSVENGSLVTASFGVIELGPQEFTETRTIQVTNRGATSKDLDVAYLERTGQDGVSVTVAPAQVTVAPGASENVTVTLTVTDPTALARTPEGDPEVFLDALLVTTVSGIVEFTEAGGGATRVAVAATLKPTSDMHALAPEFSNGEDMGRIELTGRGLSQGGDDSGVESPYLSLAAPLQLGTTDPVGDAQDIGLGPVSAAASDIVAVGASSDFPFSEDIDLTTLTFGVAVADDWGTLNPYTAPVLYISTDGDAIADYQIVATPGGGWDEQYVATINLATGDLVDFNYVNLVGPENDTNMYATNVVMYPVLAAALGIKTKGGNSKISYWFQTENALTGAAAGLYADRSTPALFDVRDPELYFDSPIVEDQPYVDSDDAQWAGEFGVYRKSASTTARVMLLHFNNAKGARYEILGQGPESVTAPEVSGGTQIGDQLTVSRGTWKNATAAMYTYQWYRDETKIAGATKANYRLATADLDTFVWAEVTATTAAGRARANSEGVLVMAADAKVALKLSKSKVRYPKSNVTAHISLGADAAAVSGTIVVSIDDEPFDYIASPARSATATVKLPKGLFAGRYRVDATFMPDEDVTSVGFGMSTARKLVIKKAKAKIRVKTVRKVGTDGKPVVLRAKVGPKSATGGGKVVVKRGKKIVAKARIVQGKATFKLAKLKAGKHTLRVVFQGSINASKAKSKKVTVRVR